MRKDLSFFLIPTNAPSVTSDAFLFYLARNQCVRAVLLYYLIFFYKRTGQMGKERAKERERERRGMKQRTLEKTTRKLRVYIREKGRVKGSCRVLRRYILLLNIASVAAQLV